METITIFWAIAIIAVVGVLIWYFMSGKKESGEKTQGFQVPPVPEKSEEPEETDSENRPEV
jgi:flagellar basal body-associated protein FliL